MHFLKQTYLKTGATEKWEGGEQIPAEQGSGA